MQRIIDYSFLFQKTSGKGISNPIGSFRVSQLNSPSIQAQLKAAGIDTKSKRYKAAIKQMMSSGAKGDMFTNIQGIKNLMKNYDRNGDFIDPTTGLTGLLVTEENEKTRKRIIDIPESSKEEMFEQTKKEFLLENGVANGDTTKRSDVYTNMYWKVTKKDRLAAGYTMEQYERAYRRAFVEAAKKADPNWKVGMTIKPGALDSVTREDVERNMNLSGSKINVQV